MRMCEEFCTRASLVAEINPDGSAYETRYEEGNDRVSRLKDSICSGVFTGATTTRSASVAPSEGVLYC